MYVRAAQWREQELTSGWVLRNLVSPLPLRDLPLPRRTPRVSSRSDGEWRINARALKGRGLGYLKPRLYTPACVYQSWHFAWKSISTVRRCHIVRAILHAGSGYSLSGMYLAPAIGPCHMMRDSRWAAIQFSYSRIPLSLSEKMWDTVIKSETFAHRMDKVFFFLKDRLTFIKHSQKWWDFTYHFKKRNNQWWILKRSLAISLPVN